MLLLLCRSDLSFLGAYLFLLPVPRGTLISPGRRRIYPLKISEVSAETAVSCELPSGIAFVVESEAGHPFGMYDGSHSDPGVFKSERSPELQGSLLH